MATGGDLQHSTDLAVQQLLEAYQTLKFVTA